MKREEKHVVKYIITKLLKVLQINDCCDYELEIINKDGLKERVEIWDFEYERLKKLNKQLEEDLGQ